MQVIFTRTFGVIITMFLFPVVREIDSLRIINVSSAGKNFLVNVLENSTIASLKGAIKRVGELANEPKIYFNDRELTDGWRTITEAGLFNQCNVTTSAKPSRFQRKHTAFSLESLP